MSFSQIFSLAAIAVLPLWLLMVFVPTWRWTGRIVSQPWAYVPLAVLYAVLVLTRFGEVAQAVVINPRLETVAPLLATPAGATIAWVHFLAFDVFVGRWAYLDARSRGIHPLVMGPILVVTFLFGPMGLLLHVAVSRLVLPRLLSPPVPPRLMVSPLPGKAAQADG
jgi:Domain of unknown function (DUF4281)